MSRWRLFTAPGNPRIWFSLVLYTAALVAIVVYRERIGKGIADGFQALTGPAPAAPRPPAKAEKDAADVRDALALPAPQHRERLLTLARAGNDPALRELSRTMEARPPAARPTDALAQGARAALDEGARDLRTVAARIVLWAEGVPATKASARALAKKLASEPDDARRRDAWRRLGILGLAGVRSGQAERHLPKALRHKNPEVRRAAARAAGRIADPAFLDLLLARVVESEVPAVRESALRGLVDLALSGRIRDQILRILTARLADKAVSGALAEQIWRAMRRIGGTGGRGQPGPTGP